MLEVLRASDICTDLVLTSNMRSQFRQVERIVAHYSLESGGSAPILTSRFANRGARVRLIGWITAIMNTADSPLAGQADVRLKAKANIRRLIPTTRCSALSLLGGRVANFSLNQLGGAMVRYLAEPLMSAKQASCSWRKRIETSAWF